MIAPNYASNPDDSDQCLSVLSQVFSFCAADQMAYQTLWLALEPRLVARQILSSCQANVPASALVFVVIYFKRYSIFSIIVQSMYSLGTRFCGTFQHFSTMGSIKLPRSARTRILLPVSAFSVSKPSLYSSIYGNGSCLYWGSALS